MPSPYNATDVVHTPVPVHERFSFYLENHFINFRKINNETRMLQVRTLVHGAPGETTIDISEKMSHGL